MAEGTRMKSLEENLRKTQENVAEIGKQQDDLRTAMEELRHSTSQFKDTTNQRLDNLAEMLQEVRDHIRSSSSSSAHATGVPQSAINQGAHDTDSGTPLANRGVSPRIPVQSGEVPAGETAGILAPTTMNPNLGLGTSSPGFANLGVSMSNGGTHSQGIPNSGIPNPWNSNLGTQQPGFMNQGSLPSIYPQVRASMSSYGVDYWGYRDPPPPPISPPSSYRADYCPMNTLSAYSYSRNHGNGFYPGSMDVCGYETETVDRAREREGIGVLSGDERQEKDSDYGRQERDSLNLAELRQMVKDLGRCQEKMEVPDQRINKNSKTDQPIDENPKELQIQFDSSKVHFCTPRPEIVDLASKEFNKPVDFGVNSIEFLLVPSAHLVFVEMPRSVEWLTALVDGDISMSRYMEIIVVCCPYDRGKVLALPHCLDKGICCWNVTFKEVMSVLFVTFCISSDMNLVFDPGIKGLDCAMKVSFDQFSCSSAMGSVQFDLKLIKVDKFSMPFVVEKWIFEVLLQVLYLLASILVVGSWRYSSVALRKVWEIAWIPMSVVNFPC